MSSREFFLPADGRQRHMPVHAPAFATPVDRALLPVRCCSRGSEEAGTQPLTLPPA